MSTEPGTRVGAIRNIGLNLKAYFFGWGVYQGNEPCPRLGGHPNPKIQLDNGKVVWGCECWWGPEERIKRELDGLTIEIVEPEDGDSAKL